MLRNPPLFFQNWWKTSSHRFKKLCNPKQGKNKVNHTQVCHSHTAENQKQNENSKSRGQKYRSPCPQHHSHDILLTQAGSTVPAPSRHQNVPSQLESPCLYLHIAEYLLLTFPNTTYPPTKFEETFAASFIPLTKLPKVCYSPTWNISPLWGEKRFKSVF